MKRFNILLVFFMLVMVCHAQESQQSLGEGNDLSSADLFFGTKINASGTISEADMAKKYENMMVTDTVRTKFKATVTDVCKVKGCWMKLQLQHDETMVRFKDYGFFVPRDIIGKEVIVNGAAFVESMSVEDQKHYAKDGGGSAAEIAKITEPKKIYSFEADGVLLIAQ